MYVKYSALQLHLTMRQTGRSKGLLLDCIRWSSGLAIGLTLGLGLAVRCNPIVRCIINVSTLRCIIMVVNAGGLCAPELLVTCGGAMLQLYQIE